MLPSFSFLYIDIFYFVLLYITTKAGSIPIKKVYIDRRFKIKDSNSNSDFKYELVESIQLLDTCVCFVDDVVISVPWYNIDESNQTVMYDDFKT